MQLCVFKKDDWKCPETALEGKDLCIFHDKSDWPYQNANTLANTLKERIESRLSPGNKEDPVRFDGAIFPEADIYIRTYERSVSFAGAEFHRAFFDGAKFLGKVTSFEGAKFKNARFEGVEFSGDVVFKKAQFSEGSNFKNAIFSCNKNKNKIDFTEASFQEGGFFDDAELRSETISFAKVRFAGNISFIGTKFYCKDHISFESAQFGRPGFVGSHAKTIFRGEEPGGIFLEGKVNFKSVAIDQEEFIFEWVNLSQVEFLDTDISKVKFIDVEWYKRPNFLKFFGGWRSRLYDEDVWRETRKKNRGIDDHYLTQLSYLYRTLKRYYLDRGEINLVGHFHYGFMEVLLRKEKRILKRILSLQHLYRISSGYGEDYGLAIIVLLTLILLFGGIYTILEVPKVYEDRSWIPDQFLNSLLYSFQAATLSRISFYQESLVWLPAKYLHLMESILAPAQFAFVVIALRNRFRR